MGLSDVQKCKNWIALKDLTLKKEEFVWFMLTEPA